MMNQATGASETPSPERHYLYPGTLFVHRKPHLITTVLGSCVSVCLWNKTSQLGGINHYLLPLWNGEGLPTPKYGNIAISKLHEKVRAYSNPGDKLIAKVFGGASMWDKDKGDNFFCVGNVNSRFIQEFLGNEGIPLVTADLEGDRGRVIYFSFGDFAVHVRKIQKTIGSNVVKRERKFWKSSIKAQKRQEIKPEIWS